MPFHFTTSIEKPDGIFHVRLYCLDTATNLTQSSTGLMAQHMNTLPTAVPVAQSLVLQDGIGELDVEYENQFFQGAPSFSNMKLSMQADPVLAPLVKAIRDRAEIWCEIVLEQFADHIPDPMPGEMFYPRKKRLYFWGKVLLQESKLHLKAQQRTPKSYTDRSYFIANQDHRDHYGRLDLTLIHWFKVLTAVKPDYFLNSFWLAHSGAVNQKARYSEFLEAIVHWINPAPFWAVSDHRLKTTDANEGLPSGVSRCNLQLAGWLSGSSAITGGGWAGTMVSNVYDLYHGGMATTLGAAVRAPLFNNSTDKGAFSFYNIANLGELFILFIEEFQFKSQCELPTLEEAYLPRIPKGLTNNHVNRMANWEKCSRWLFWDVRAPFLGIYDFPGAPSEISLVPKPIFMNPLNDTIDAQPFGSWTGKISGTDPLGRETQIFGASADGAVDIAIKTLFCFVEYDSGFTDNAVGPEIYLFDDIGNVVYARQFKFVGGTHDFAFTSQVGMWTYFHVYRFALVFGAQTAILELDYEGIGLEPFGKSATNPPLGISHYGFDDFGEFPMFRIFYSNPSILLDAHTQGEFRIFGIKRTLGHSSVGTTHIKAYLQFVDVFVDVPPPVPPAPKPPPPVITPPANITTEPICGMITFIFGVAFAGDVCQTTATVDGTPIASTIASAGGFIVGVQVIINSCLLSVGVHSICITITPCDPAISPTTTCWSFNVNHTCCADPTASTTLHI